MTDEHFIVICKPGGKVLLLRVEEDALLFSVSRPKILDILLNELFRNWSESTRAAINTCYGDYCFCYPSPEGIQSVFPKQCLPLHNKPFKKVVRLEISDLLQA
jgi:hypothetical protein